MPELVALAVSEKRRPAERLELLKAIQQGAQERGLALDESSRRLAARLAGQLLGSTQPSDVTLGIDVVRDFQFRDMQAGPEESDRPPRPRRAAPHARDGGPDGHRPEGEPRHDRGRARGRFGSDRDARVGGEPAGQPRPARGEDGPAGQSAECPRAAPVGDRRGPGAPSRGSRCAACRRSRPARRRRACFRSDPSPSAWRARACRASPIESPHCSRACPRPTRS